MKVWLAALLFVCTTLAQVTGSPTAKVTIV